MTLSKSIKFYLDGLLAENKSKQSIKIYTHNLRLFFQHTGDMPISEVSANHIRSFLAARSEGKEPTTVHSSFRNIRAFFNWCIREGFIENTPLVNIKAPKLSKKVIETFSQAEIQNMISHCNQKSFLGARNVAIIAVLLDTGIRENELVTLKTNVTDFRSGIIKVHGKGDKERVVRIASKAIKLLAKYMFLRDDQIDHVESPNPDSHVFLSEECRPLTNDGLCTIFSKLGDNAGIRAYAHKFRHTCAVEFLRAGGDLRTLQIMLGHENISTTARYLTAMNADDVINAHRQHSPGDKFL